MTKVAAAALAAALAGCGGSPSGPLTPIRPSCTATSQLYTLTNPGNGQALVPTGGQTLTVTFSIVGPGTGLLVRFITVTVMPSTGPAFDMTLNTVSGGAYSATLPTLAPRTQYVVANSTDVVGCFATQ
jgi:hypothetical protein